MRHRVAGKKLNRSAAHRTAMRRTMVTQLLKHDRIRTTRAKAQAVRGQAERLITLAKRSIQAGTDDPARVLHARRLAAARINDPEVVQKLFDEIAPMYMDRPGGYTRILKMGLRKGDAAPVVLLELVQED